MICYRIPTDEDYWGSETTPEQANVFTDNYGRLCELFSKLHSTGVEVEIEFVPETVSTMNQTNCTVCGESDGGCSECETIISTLNELAFQLNFNAAYERKLDDNELAQLCQGLLVDAA